MKKSLLLLIMMVASQYYATAQYARWVVEPIYDEIAEFVGDVAAVKRDGKWGYINKECVEVIECKFDNITSFVEGVAIATTNENILQAIIHEDGLIIDRFRNINGGALTLSVDPRYKFYGNDMLLVTDGSTGLADNKKYTQWGYIDKNGILRHPIKYFAAMPFCEGRAGVADEKMRYYYINNEGEIVIARNRVGNGKATGAFGFYNGVAIICEKGQFYYIDKSGRKDLERSVSNNNVAKQPYYEISSNIIECSWSQVIIDPFGRISKIVKKDHSEILLINQPEEQSPIVGDNGFTLNGVLVKESAKWINSTFATLEYEGKWGIIKVQSTPVVKVELSSDSVYSIFGNIEPLPFVLRSSDNLDIRELEDLNSLKITINGVESTKSTIPASGFKSTLSIEKPSDLERERVPQVIQVTQRGVLLLEEVVDIEIVNNPSLTIIGNSDYKHYADGGEDIFSISIDICNNSNYELQDANLAVNNYQKSISIAPNTTKTFPVFFGAEITGETISISILVKPNKSPVITKQGSLRINK